MKIVYECPNTGYKCVIHPTGEISVDEVARKDVPEGLPYMIIEDDHVSSWKDGSLVFIEHGKGIGATNWFIEKIDEEISIINSEVPPTKPSLPKKPKNNDDEKIALIQEAEAEPLVLLDVPDKLETADDVMVVLENEKRKQRREAKIASLKETIVFHSTEMSKWQTEVNEINTKHEEVVDGFNKNKLERIEKLKARKAIITGG